MKQKTNKVKRIFITTLATVCALSSTAAISANAASEQYVHTVEVSSIVRSNDATWITMKSKGTCSDTFGNFPTIYNNYNTSTNKSRAEHSDGKTYTDFKSFTLQKDNPSYPSVSYGSLKSGSWRLYYEHTSGGGFKDSVTTIKRY